MTGNGAGGGCRKGGAGGDGDDGGRGEGSSGKHAATARRARGPAATTATMVATVTLSPPVTVASPGRARGRASTHARLSRSCASFIGARAFVCQARAQRVLGVTRARPWRCGGSAPS